MTLDVFLLGGTGSIGTGLVTELVARGHRVTALSRSAASDHRLQAMGAQVLRGDVMDPAHWMPAALSHDAFVQAAATFGDDMAEADNRVVSQLLADAERTGPKLRVLYTGGCWLYGDTGGNTATETSAFDPLPAFAWMVHHAQRLLQASHLSVAVVHPAMVYHLDGGGVFERFRDAARSHDPVEIWGNPNTRWPLIERHDLARAYCDLLVRPDLRGHFNAVAQQGVRVGDIANTITHFYASQSRPVVRSVADVMQAHGAWAKGPTLDQSLSSAKLQTATGWHPRFTKFQAALNLHTVKAS
ncbi:NAD-dependent epimerase/dehydratase family protein [Ascidiaceihabitans sp.]|uniref:NAD-dependent epimerase/dehydratase family protein n=1 Tax=Ascidiaceihabitans sp. TaxID=1872644 RepID=UPI003297F721